ncbi:MAG: 50S ribosomal protein L10 [Nitrospirae bacterium]|nr:50S ribosomal protein L10 [Nitrospirota bacterium]
MKAKGVVFTDYKGLTVQELGDFRKTLRAAAIDYKVVKNTLAKKASSGTSIDAAKGEFAGPIGIAFSYDDPILLAKKVLEFANKNEKLRIRGGVIEGGLCSAEDVKSVAQLPPRGVLLSMFIGAMQSPLSRLAGALNATLSGFICAMEALKNKKLKVES